MKTDPDFNQKFLTERDHTGRFLVKSFRTGKTYFVEPIEKERPATWGDVTNGIKDLEGSYGHKYRGAINEKDSMITKENGFNEKEIHMLDAGVSPMSYIDELDSKHPSII